MVKSSSPLGVGDPVYTGPLGTWRVSQRLTSRSLEPLEYNPECSPERSSECSPECSPECSESGDPELL